MIKNIAKNINHSLRSKHAAILVEKKKIISIGINKMKSHPVQKQFTRDPELAYIHAEVDCLKSISKLNVKRATLYVVRVNKNGNLAESCPCDGCKKLIQSIGISRLVYSIDGGIIENVKFAG